MPNTTLIENIKITKKNFEGFDKMIDTLDVDYPYLAGMIDGDGYIGIKDKERQRNRIFLAITDREVPELLANIFKSRLFIKDEREYDAKRHPQNRCDLKVRYATEINGMRGISLVKRIYPFMHEKQGDAAKYLSKYNEKIPFPVKMNHDQFMSYLAGFVDAEGHIANVNGFSITNTVESSIKFIHTQIKNYYLVDVPIQIIPAYSKMCPHRKKIIHRKTKYAIGYYSANFLNVMIHLYDKMKIKRKKKKVLDIVHRYMYEMKNNKPNVKEHLKKYNDFWRIKLSEKEKLDC